MLVLVLWLRGGAGAPQCAPTLEGLQSKLYNQWDKLLNVFVDPASAEAETKVRHA